jgi:transcriptional regulator with XRE-family HTH domain
VIKITLRAARHNARLTQKEMAEKLGVSNSTLCNWENGLSFPDAPHIDKICELLGLSYDNLNFLPNNSLKANGKEQ